MTLPHLEAEMICGFGLLRAHGGLSGLPKARLGATVTRYILKMFVNELGVLEIVYLGRLFPFLAHLEAEICDFGLLKARGGLSGPPKAQFRG